MSDELDPISWKNRHRIYPSGYCEKCGNNPCLGDEINKYPATQRWLRQVDLQKTRPMFCITVNMNEVETEVKSILAARQRDEEIIRELVGQLTNTLNHVREFEDAWRRGSITAHDGLGALRANRNVEIRVMLSEAINAAELRLKEV